MSTRCAHRAVAWLSFPLGLGLFAGLSSAAPTVMSFTPRSGPPGTLVKIIGTELQDLGRVQFGDQTAASFWVVTPNHIKAQVPDLAETAPVIVVTTGGVAVSAESFVVVRPVVVLPGLALAPPRPNPARGAMGWSFVAPRTGHARLVLFDVRGRAVRELWNAETPAGAHETVWDGLDRHGHRAPPGLYLARLEFAGVTLTRRAVLLSP